MIITVIALQKPVRPVTGGEPAGSPHFALRRHCICQGVFIADVDVRTVRDHIQKVYSDSELDEKATIRKFWIVQAEGLRQVSREVNYYNLQMIIALGFKVNNERAEHIILHD